MYGTVRCYVPVRVMHCGRYDTTIPPYDSSIYLTALRGYNKARHLILIHTGKDASSKCKELLEEIVEIRCLFQGYRLHSPDCAFCFYPSDLF